MKNYANRIWVSAALVALLAPACADNDNDYGTGTVNRDKPAQTTTKDAGQVAKDAGKQAVTELKNTADGLERFANSLQEGLGDATYNVSQSIKAKMPEVENLIEKVKGRLNAGDEDMRESAAKLDEKLTDLRNKLAMVGDDAAVATKETKEDAADAFKSLMDNIQNGIEKLD